MKNPTMRDPDSLGFVFYIEVIDGQIVEQLLTTFAFWNIILKV